MNNSDLKQLIINSDIDGIKTYIESSRSMYPLDDIINIIIHQMDSKFVISDELFDYLATIKGISLINDIEGTLLKLVNKYRDINKFVQLLHHTYDITLLINLIDSTITNYTKITRLSSEDEILYFKETLLISIEYIKERLTLSHIYYIYHTTPTYNKYIKNDVILYFAYRVIQLPNKLSNLTNPDIILLLTGLAITNSIKGDLLEILLKYNTLSIPNDIENLTKPDNYNSLLSEDV